MPWACRGRAVGGPVPGRAIQGVSASVVFTQPSRLTTHLSGCVPIVKWHVTALRSGLVGHVIVLCFISRGTSKLFSAPPWPHLTSAPFPGQARGQVTAQGPALCGAGHTWCPHVLRVDRGAAPIGGGSPTLRSRPWTLTLIVSHARLARPGLIPPRAFGGAEGFL